MTVGATVAGLRPGLRSLAAILLLLPLSSHSVLANPGFESDRPFGPEESPAVITRQRLAAGKISPMQYGQFIEYLCNLVPGMWAEMLDDGSFEGLSPYKVTFLKEKDFRERPWYPTGATNRRPYSSETQPPGFTAPLPTRSRPLRACRARWALVKMGSRSARGCVSLVLFS